MALVFTGRTFSADDEKAMRDSHTTPDTGLEDALLDAQVELAKAGAMTRAHEKYVDTAENGTQGEKNNLPIYTDTDLMLAWYYGLPGYQNKAQREA